MSLHGLDCLHALDALALGAPGHSLAQGDIACVSGILQRPVLNGSKVRLLSYNTDCDRWTVDILGQRATSNGALRIKTCNLVVEPNSSPTMGGMCAGTSRMANAAENGEAGEAHDGDPKPPKSWLRRCSMKTTVELPRGSSVLQCIF